MDLGFWLEVAAFQDTAADLLDNSMYVSLWSRLSERHLVGITASIFKKPLLPVSKASGLKHCIACRALR